jgi:molecular chaperone DnaJ
VQHKQFERQENDLITTVKLNVFDLIRGCSATVKGLDNNEIQFNVPPGTQPEEKITIEGYGINNSQTKRKGDLLVKIKIEIPTKITSRANKLIEELQYEFTRKS